MASLAEIYVLDVPFHADRAYTYHIPVTLEDSVLPGVAAEVPFGRGNRQMTGIVTAVREGIAEEGIKPVASVLGDGPVLDGEMISLCLFLKEYTLCTFGEAVKTVLPPGAMAKVITYYRAVQENESVTAALQAVYRTYGERGRTVYRLIRDKARFTRPSLLTEVDFDPAGILGAMERRGIIERITETRAQSTGVVRRFLAPGFETDGEAAWERAAAPLNGKNQIKLLHALRQVNPDGEAAEDAVFAEAGLTTTAGRNAVKALEARGLIRVTETAAYRNPFAPESLGTDAAPKPLVLTDEQERAYQVIQDALDGDEPAGILLHGVTGSGKTSVILAAIEHTLSSGRGVIMLVPEIALTPQTVRIFVRRFGERVAVIHSGLSAGERYDAWRRIRGGQADVVIGTRSAIFAPLSEIGLIVIDEEQEYTYKSDTNPKYHAHDIARLRCRDHRATLILSSATPSVVSYYKAETGKLKLVELKERYGEASLPTVEICDMRGEAMSGNLSPVGSRLKQLLEEDRAAGNQAILFLNRRGYHNYVSCRSCGKSVKCPHCSVTLTYHTLRGRNRHIDEEGEAYEQNRRENGILICHTCGHRQRVPETCPECGGAHFLFMGAGTQKAEGDIEALLPGLRVLRMDTDTTQTKFSHEEILNRFRQGEADVLLGTQMVTKGHDFPRVATVGVLNADNALYVDDYRASERTFSMLTQVIGRAGRASVPGTAVIQTHNPSNEVLLLAAEQNYRIFYEGEIRLRRALCFPPFCDIAVVTLSCEDESLLGLVTTRMKERMVELTRESFSDVPLVVFGPFEAPVYRVQNACRMRFVFKCRLNRRTRAFLADLISEFSKAGPNRYTGGMVRTGTSKRLTVSVDLNPSTV